MDTVGKKGLIRIQVSEKVNHIYIVSPRDQDALLKGYALLQARKVTMFRRYNSLTFPEISYGKV